MERPEMFLVPVLMLADYYLTLLGARMSEGYRRHFAMQEYELNPIWQESIRAGVRFNPRQLAGVVLMTAVFFVFQWPPSGLGLEFDLVFGFFLGIYGTVVGRHLANLVQFRYLNTHPGAISGQVVVPYEYSLRLSRWQYLGVAVPVFLLAVLTRQQMVIGAAVGLLFLMLAHYFWAAVARRRQPRPPAVA